MNGLQRRETVSAMVEAYQEAERDIREAYRLLDQAEQRLVAGFAGQAGDYVPCMSVWPNQYEIGEMDIPHAASKVDSKMLYLKSKAWQAVGTRLEVTKVMSGKKKEEYEKALKRTLDLPEINEANVTSWIQDMAGSIADFATDAAIEVFKALTPNKNYDKYKTNSDFRIGKKVIITAFYPDRWDQQPNIAYGHEKTFQNIDNIMHILDGKGPVKDYYGELLGLFKTDHANPREFGVWYETTYFRAKMHKNGKCHLEFKRLDLVKMLNEIGGDGKTLAA